MPQRSAVSAPPRHHRARNSDLSAATVILTPARSLSSALSRSSTDRSELTDEQAAFPDRDPYLLAQVRETFGRVVYSHKTPPRRFWTSFQPSATSAIPMTVSMRSSSAASSSSTRLDNETVPL